MPQFAFKRAAAGAKTHPPKSPCVGGVRYAADGGNGSVVAAALPGPTCWAQRRSKWWGPNFWPNFTKKRKLMLLQAERICGVLIALCCILPGNYPMGEPFLIQNLFTHPIFPKITFCVPLDLIFACLPDYPKGRLKSRPKALLRGNSLGNMIVCTSTHVK